MTNFICPVKNARLTSKFGWRTINKNKEWHQGIDLASTGKVPIYASADGIVSRAQVLSSYGNVVMIKHTINGKIYETNYAHLDSYSVKVGQRVKQGQQIGIMGNTGRSFGIHLHFEIHDGLWKTGQPNAIDPMKYITLKDTPPKDKGELDMQLKDATSSTLKKSYIEKLEQAHKSGKIGEQWIKQAKNGTLNVVDMILLTEYIR